MKMREKEDGKNRTKSSPIGTQLILLFCFGFRKRCRQYSRHTSVVGHCAASPWPRPTVEIVWTWFGRWCHLGEKQNRKENSNTYNFGTERTINCRWDNAFTHNVLPSAAIVQMAVAVTQFVIKSLPITCWKILSNVRFVSTSPKPWEPLWYAANRYFHAHSDTHALHAAFVEPNTNHHWNWSISIGNKKLKRFVVELSEA